MLKKNQVLLKMIMVITSLFLVNNTAIANAGGCNNLIIPIVFDGDGIPYLEVKINNDKQLALFDLGAEEGIHIPKKLLNKFENLEYTGRINKSSNIQGSIVSSKEFIIPSLSVGCLTFQNIVGAELAPWAASLGERSEDNHDTAEQRIIIGRGLFKNTSINIDYKNKQLIVHNQNTDKLASQDQSFFIKKEGIVIHAKTSIKTYKMVIDTGASSSIFVLDKVPNNENTKSCDYDLGENLQCKLLNATLTIGDNDFSSNILLYPIDSRFKMDGILGNDFFNAFQLALNFKTQAYSLVKY